MKKYILSLSCLLILVLGARAQAPAQMGAAMNQSRDFLVFGISVDSWPSLPDSISTTGFSHGFQFSFNYDISLKEGSHFSVAPGIGFSGSHVNLKNRQAILGGTTSTLEFRETDAYKKNQVVVTYVEIPIELRYRAFSENANKGFKAGIGLKLGALIDGKTKDKLKVGNNGQTEKVKNKQYFESWRIAGTARVGYGHFSVFANYSLTNLFQTTSAAKINPLAVGIAISGF